MTYDGSGSLFALGMRLTKLDQLGAPLAGEFNCYVTDALVAVGIGLEYEEGQEVSQPNGAGRICLYYKAPDTLKRGVISDFQVCSPDPNVLEFTIGGDVITTGGSGTAEVQTATITGIPTGGDFTFGYAGEDTGVIAWNAAAATVQAALLALPNLEPGDVTVTGSAGGPYTITFSASIGNVDELTADGTGLTGGTAPGVTIVTVTPGDNLTDIGYRAPEVGSDPKPYGLSVEFWSNAIEDGVLASSLPYFHWTLPRAFLKPSENWTLNGENATTPQFEGWCNQNKNWGSGPAGDWLYPSDRVWQFARVAAMPDLTPGFVEVA